MKASTLIPWLLFAAFCVLDLALMGEIQLRKNEWPGAGGIFGIGLAFSQISLISIWAVWGSKGLVVRAVSTLLAVLATAFLASYSTDGHGRESNEWFGILLLYCSMTTTPFIVLRLCGYNFVVAERSSPRQSTSQIGTNQYTVWGLLSLMTAVGITSAVLRAVDFPMSEAFDAAVFFGLLASVTCAASFLLLRWAKVWLPIVGSMVAFPVMGIVLNQVGFAPQNDKVELVVAICIQGGATTAAALVIRAGGFRIERTNNAITASESSDAATLEPEAQDDEL